MPSNDALTRRILKEHQAAFDAFEEYDRTGKMPRLNRKLRVDITLDAHLLRTCKHEFKARGMKLSPTIELLLRDKLQELEYESKKKPLR